MSPSFFYSFYLQDREKVETPTRRTLLVNTTKIHHKKHDIVFTASAAPTQDSGAKNPGDTTINTPAAPQTVSEDEAGVRRWVGPGRAGWGGHRWPGEEIRSRGKRVVGRDEEPDGCCEKDPGDCAVKKKSRMLMWKDFGGSEVVKWKVSKVMELSQ